ncbi:TPA: ead/Ea22-like family protein [Enterobacter hormaechei subsp. xiangfangensis]|nr:ead/Ea22-like family protein [Enterobacter hormaechei subsp. xiangfangensis]
MNVKRYEWVACDEHACHCDVIESAEGDMVDYEDYAALEARCAALAAENAGLNKYITQSCYVFDGEQHEISDAYICATDGGIPETPATDAFLDDLREQAHKEGAHFVANRMLAAWEAGFIDDTAKNASDIARMILTSTEFMADAPEGDFDRSFADGVLEDIAVQLRKGVQS